MAINSLTLLSLPVAMGTMHEVAKCCGPSPKGFLLMAPAGSFFVDRANAVVARDFLSRPFFAIPPLAGGGPGGPPDAERARQSPWAGLSVNRVKRMMKLFR